MNDGASATPPLNNGLIPPADFVTAVSHALGANRVTTDPDMIAPGLVDWRRRYHGAACALVEPRTTAEVATLVALAAQARVPLVPQGGNTGMVGGATPDPSGTAALVSLRRMTAIRTVDAGARLLVAEAGVTLAAVHAAAAAHGLRFPLTLGARGTATVGGLVATSAGGTQVLRFGTMRALVAGVEAVLPPNDFGAGGVWNGLTGLAKDNRGFDLGQLLLGSEGTLGIVTAAALRLVPAAGDRAVAWLGVRDPATALTLLRRFEAAHGGIESFELLPAESLAAVLAHLPGARAPLAGRHPWHVLVELTAAGDARAALEALAARALEEGLVEDAMVAQTERQAEALWRLRDAISDAERALGPAVQHDIAVPVAAMPAFMAEASATLEAAFPGTRASGFGHLGDGNIHFHVRAPAGAGADWTATEGAAASRMVHDLVTAAGGTISAEHGIGQMKRDELARLADPVRLAALRAVKHALDPLGIMNPGKLV